MAKKEFLAFRLAPELKQQIEEIAVSEERSISQICEILLRGGIDAYRKEGPEYLQRLLRKHKADTR